MFERQIWDEISLEIMNAARSGMAVKDFEIQCRLAPILNGKSYFDRIRVAENLISSNLICHEDGYLKIVSGNIPDSLVDNLLSGSEVAWKILDCIDPSKKLLQKLDRDLLSKIGLDGELAVINELKAILPSHEFSKIRHISLVDDSAGFDIQAPSTVNVEEALLLEVKTSVRPGDYFTFYISKNEARVARQNINWFLVGVEASASGLKVMGRISFIVFSDLLPLNQSDHCEWETAKIILPKKVFINGLP